MGNKENYKPTPYFNTPKYKDWRKKDKNSKTKDLSELFPVSATKDGEGMQIEFRNENGEKINFYLPKLEMNLMLMQIDINIRGLNVSRSDYDMDELQKQRHLNRAAQSNHKAYIERMS